MNPIVIVVRRLVVIVLVVAMVAIAAILGLSKVGYDVLPPPQMRQLHASAGYVGTKAMQAKEYLGGKFGSWFEKHSEEHHAEHSKIVATSPKTQDVTITIPFVCQIRSQRHIEVRALEGGYLRQILIREGQSVKEGDLMFKILPVLFQARLDTEIAEAKFRELQWLQAKKLAETKVVSEQDVMLHHAEMQKAVAKRELALAELNFTELKAPFGGIVDRLLEREGSLIKEGDILTTLADNSVMWVYFNVPEKYYLEYMAHREQREKEDKIELMLANGDMFQEIGTIGAIEADFNNENGNIKFRADYPNPKRLLRHGQTGTIKIRRPLPNSLLIPQRATFERLDKRYVWVIDDDHVAHQTLITTSHELEDIFVVGSGLKATDKIVLEGVREVEEGGKVEYEFHKPEEVLKDQKQHAE